MIGDQISAVSFETMPIHGRIVSLTESWIAMGRASAAGLLMRVTN